MKKLRFVVSLTTHDNDFQMEQAASAQHTANRLGVDIEILYADNDAIQQSQQLLQIIQSSSGHPDGIIFEPAGGTGFPQVAKAAAAAGIGWVVMNREVEYLTDLRHAFKTPIFSVTSDHEEIGRIQGKQVAALLPQGGSILLMQGPAESTAAKQRMTGLYDTKPVGVQVKMMKGNWTEAGAYKAIGSWLKLSTSLQTQLDVVVSQNDAMAIGVRKAFQEIADPAVRERFAHLPYIGIDGVRTTGQEWLRKGLLSATVVVPPNTDLAIQMLTHAVQTGIMPPEKTLTVPKSLPTVEELAKKPVQRSQAAGAQSY
jgi:ribose transport system substrate-binding protein